MENQFTSGQKDISERQRRRARASVITVGDGRGFVLKGPQDTRLVVTAAHCLPFFPPANGASDLSERTYKRLLAPLGTKPAVWAECLFADPIADLAVLGSPDDQELTNEAHPYGELVQSATRYQSLRRQTKDTPGCCRWSANGSDVP